MIPAIPRQVVFEMARLRCRFHYYLWHRVRNSWCRLTEQEREAVRRVAPAWVPPRPSLDITRRPLRENDSGEDFLFMHRRMLGLADDILARVGDPRYPRVEGWRRIPPPDDPDYPVPDFPESELEEVKATEYFHQVIAPWERQYRDPEYLTTVTLGQLGSDLQFTIHGALHVRWAAPSLVGYRPSSAAGGEINRRWDTPSYEYLGDTYSCHVNPLFWKIHGWIDDRVEQWKRVRGIAGEVGWKGTWVGPQASHPPADAAPHGAADGASAADDVPDEWQRLDRIISASAASEMDGFFRPPTRALDRRRPLRGKSDGA